MVTSGRHGEEPCDSYTNIKSEKAKISWEKKPR